MVHIKTTHVGSLPRPDNVCDLLRRGVEGDRPSRCEFEAALGPAVNAVVGKQVDHGIDVVSDGEFAKLGYANYLTDRLSGFAGDSPRLPGADLAEFPGYVAKLAERRKNALPLPRPCCIGPIEVVDKQPLADDLARLRAAVDRHAPKGAFMNAPSPGVVAIFQPNQHYGCHQSYLEAIARAMRYEYQGIIDAGFDLQIDCPDLGMGRHTIFQAETDEGFLKHARIQVEILNEALDGLPPERMRMHLCWGNYEGPHHHDIALRKIVDIVLAAKPSTLLFEAANPRHAHEWRVFAETRIPDDKILCPGVIDSCSNYIEHPELIAERLLRFADIVGADRVMAGSDCGFSTFAGDGLVDGEIVWAKFKAMRRGTDIAATQLSKG